MGLSTDKPDRAALMFDAETVAIDRVADYVEPAQAPDNYKDPSKIDAFIVQANANQLAKAALDVDLARIVALGVLGDTETEPEIHTARDEQDERDVLAWFWRVARPLHARPTLIGYNCVAFDCPLLVRRSLYLGVPHPRLPLNRYRHDGIEDLMLLLSFDGALKFRSLDFYVKRFSLDVPENPCSGADIAALVTAGDWATVTAHLRCDLLATAALARRVGILQPVVEAVL